MAKNQDNIDKQASGLKAKQYTLKILQECEIVTLLPKDTSLSKNDIEKATYDLKLKLNAHPDVAILVTSTNSFRDDRLDTANTRMRRVKKRYDEQGNKCICIVTSNCANERTRGDDTKYLNGYNFGEREEVGLDVLVKTDDLIEVLQVMSEVENKNDALKMIEAAKACVKKKNY